MSDDAGITLLHLRLLATSQITDAWRILARHTGAALPVLDRHILHYAVQSIDSCVFMTSLQWGAIEESQVESLTIFDSDIALDSYPP